MCTSGRPVRPHLAELPLGRSVYADNVRLRNLEVERDVPVHGVVLPWKEVLQSIEQKRKTTEKVCMGPEAPFLPGCEVAR